MREPHRRQRPGVTGSHRGPCVRRQPRYAGALRCTRHAGLRTLAMADGARMAGRSMLSHCGTVDAAVRSVRGPDRPRRRDVAAHRARLLRRRTRRYHTLEHIGEVLALLDASADPDATPPAVEFGGVAARPRVRHRPDRQRGRQRDLGRWTTSLRSVSTHAIVAQTVDSILMTATHDPPDTDEQARHALGCRSRDTRRADQPLPSATRPTYARSTPASTTTRGAAGARDVLDDVARSSTPLPPRLATNLGGASPTATCPQSSPRSVTRRDRAILRPAVAVPTRDRRPRSHPATIGSDAESSGMS